MAHRVEDLDAGIDINVDGDGVIRTAKKSEDGKKICDGEGYTVARAE